MSGPIISIRGVGKRFVLGEGTGHDTLRDQLAAGFRGLIGRKKDRRPISEHWALRGVSFAVTEGEVVGIIGRNGAGKSTLLKILSQISEPTEGEIHIRGRIASLLEVGTGFHPELSGRENIYLNGSILGMKRTEIRAKFDEIVAFAEVDKFLDTPVKRYSSGMYVRLAFAVAAHLEPEILIVDEVLAVGDVGFQKKCLNKMGEAATQGRTILFVSHNLGAIARLCNRAVLLDQGELRMDGHPVDVIKHYYADRLSVSPMWERDTPSEAEEFEFESARILNRSKEVAGIFCGNEEVEVNIRYQVKRYISGCQVGMQILDSEGSVVFTTSDGDSDNCPALPRTPGKYETSLRIPGHFLVPGVYTLFIAAHFPNRVFFDKIDQKLRFEVTVTGALQVLDGRLGAISPLFHWATKPIEAPQLVI
jgi:lipopolysaccharide transport system ATP-binding protein